MWQRFKLAVILERQVRAFVSFDQNQNRRRRFQRDPMRVYKSPGVSLPSLDRRDVMTFPGQLDFPVTPYLGTERIVVRQHRSRMFSSEKLMRGFAADRNFLRIFD